MPNDSGQWRCKWKDIESVIATRDALQNPRTDIPYKALPHLSIAVFWGLGFEPNLYHCVCIGERGFEPSFLLCRRNAAGDRTLKVT
jgi:hypothetical protein